MRTLAAAGLVTAALLLLGHEAAAHFRSEIGDRRWPAAAPSPALPAPALKYQRNIYRQRKPVGQKLKRKLRRKKSRKLLSHEKFRTKSKMYAYNNDNVHNEKVRKLSTYARSRSRKPVNDHDISNNVHKLSSGEGSTDYAALCSRLVRDPRRYLLDHPTDCGKFVSCQWLGGARYRAHVMVCPATTAFNTRLMVCTHRGCGGQQTTTRSTTILPSPFTTASTTTATTECPKKNVVSWKNSHNYLQIHPKCKNWGCFGKFRIFATRWTLRFSKLKKN